MNDQAARILTSLVARYGTSVAHDPLRCEGLLRDTCPRCNREIFVLVNAVRQQVPADLLDPRHSLPPALFRGFLVKRLQDELAFSDEAAHWAVGTWAGALGLDNGMDTREPEAASNPGNKKTGVSFPEDISSGISQDQRARLASDLESGSVDVRLATICQVAQSKDRESVRLLITGLENSLWKVREAAFDALLEMDESAIPGLVEALADSHDRVVIPVILVLGTIRAREAVDPLIALLDEDGGPGTYAVWALGEIRDDRGVTPLTRLLKSSDPRLRSEAELALRKFG
ncbi:MAG: HEAT repeat domain-containing protein [Methanoregula sp.]|nr:HEAT repeat domain-containing protein [Methanoregula sp.]